MHSARITTSGDPGAERERRRDLLLRWTVDAAEIVEMSLSRARPVTAVITHQSQHGYA
jgi:hypothetical protein